MRSTFAAIFLMAATGVANASTVTLELPGSGPVERNSVSYKCGDQTVTAEYINAGDTSLAVVKLEDQTVLMVNVLSASGARYAGRQYVWWTKGDNANLYDLTKGGEAQPEFSCEAEK